MIFWLQVFLTTLLLRKPLRNFLKYLSKKPDEWKGSDVSPSKVIAIVILLFIMIIVALVWSVFFWLSAYKLIWVFLPEYLA